MKATPTKHEQADSFFVFPPIVADCALQASVQRFKIDALGGADGFSSLQR